MTARAKERPTYGPSFDVTRSDMDLIRRVVKRARGLEPDLDPVSLAMDLTAAHANGTPLDLPRLLAFDDPNFGHDVFGIRQHIDRRTGSLLNCFVPRCAKPAWRQA